MNTFYSETSAASGYYLVDIMDARTCESDDGKPSVVLSIRINAFVSNHGEREEREASWPDRQIYLPITDNTMGTPQEPGWVRQVLDLLGMDYRSWHELGRLRKANLPATCRHDEYEGKRREKWSLLHGGKQAKPASRETLQRLAARYGHGTNGRPPAAPTGTVAPGRPAFQRSAPAPGLNPAPAPARSADIHDIPLSAPSTNQYDPIPF